MLISTSYVHMVPSCGIIPSDLENILYALIFSFLHVTFPAYFILKVLDRRQEGIRIRAALPKHNVTVLACDMALCLCL